MGGTAAERGESCAIDDTARLSGSAKVGAVAGPPGADLWWWDNGELCVDVCEVGGRRFGEMGSRRCAAVSLLPLISDLVDENKLPGSSSSASVIRLSCGGRRTSSFCAFDQRLLSQLDRFDNLGVRLGMVVNRSSMEDKGDREAGRFVGMKDGW